MRLFSQDVKVTALARTPLFSDLSKKELTQLARMSDDMEIEAGHVLCREGQTGREMFVIVDGEVEVTRKGKPVKRRGGYEVFGEIAESIDSPANLRPEHCAEVRARVVERFLTRNHPQWCDGQPTGSLSAVLS